MNTTYSDRMIYVHNTIDCSIELLLKLDVYVPYREDIDDIKELDILQATVIEAVDGYKRGQVFNVDLLDYDDVAETYFYKSK